MPPTSAAMELKVLISILSQGQTLQNMLGQVNSLSQALSKLQQQVAAGGSGQGPLPPLGPVSQGLNAIPPAAKSAEDAIKGVETAINKVVSAVKFLAGGFLALQSVRFLRNLADDAAKVEVATTVLRVVAQNAGYTAEQIDEVDKSVQKLGITARASKEALTSFLQARLPLTYAKDLARASQDLAVISGMNSSDTFKRLIVNIQQLDALGLRWMGIVVDRAAAEDKFRLKQEDTTKALNKRQQQEALMQEVLEKSKLLEGAYATAMGDVAKQLTSLDRLTETYRVALGESLLPAYSNIVRVITTTLEKLILLSQQFSANRERAKQWADAALGIATAVSEILLFIAKHIDQLVVLARLYLEWRAAIIVVNAALTIVAGLARLLVIINNLRYAFIALQAGMIGMAVAWQAIRAASTQAAISIIAQTVAQTNLARSSVAVAGATQLMLPGFAATTAAATGATAAVSGLALAWGSLAAVLAIPVVGYIIYKIKAAHEEEMKKPVIQRAAENVEGWLGDATVENVEKLLRMGRAGGPLQEMYREWLKGIDTVGKSQEELRRQFAESVVEFRRQLPLVANQSVLSDYVDRIAEVSEAVTRLTTKGEQLRKQQREAKDPVEKRALGVERQIVQRELEERQQKLTELRKEMVQAAKTRVTGAGGDDEVFIQIDKYDQAQVRYDQIRETGSRAQVARAAAEMEAEKAILEQLKAKIELRLKVEKLTDAERKADEEALASIKSRMQEVADRAERIRTSTESLFGSKFLFTPEGEVMSGQFAKELGAFQTLLDDAKEILDEEGAVPEQIAEKVKKGITALGQAAQQPVDLTRLKKVLGEVPALGLPETGRLGREAVGLAQIGVRQAQLAIRAPLVTESKEAVQRRFAPQIEAAELYLTKLKALNASENEELENSYRNNLVSLDEYFQTRIDRIEKEIDAERELQILRVEEARVLATKEEDPRAKAAADLKLKAEERKLSEIGARGELERDRLENQRAQRRKDLTREVQSQTFAQRAQFGGVTAALEQLNLQIEREAEAYRASNIVGYEDYLLKKQQAGIYDILNKARDRAHQIQIAELDTLRQQVNLQEKRRSVEAARVEAGVAAGDITEFDAQRFRNEQIQAALAENRERRRIEELELLANEAAMKKELQDIEQQGIALGKDKLEITQQQQEAQQRWNAIIQGNNSAIADLDQAFVSLEASTESYGKQLKKSFIDGFSDALTQSIINFRNAGKAWVNLANSIGNEIVSVFIRAFTQRLFAKLGIFSIVDRFMNRIFGGGGSPISAAAGQGDFIPVPGGMAFAAEGGVVSGPGTGTSDSIPAMVSTGEHIMPARQTASFLPLLEGIRTGKILPFRHGGVVQSIAVPSIIPRRYAAGGVVVGDAGAGSVQTGTGGPGNMVVTMHPDTLNMTMREWLEHEVVRQQGRR